MKGWWALLVLRVVRGPQGGDRAWTDPSDADAWEKRRGRLPPRASSGSGRRRLPDRDPARPDPRTELQRAESRRALAAQAREMRRAAMRNPTDDEMWGDLGDMLSEEGNVPGPPGLPPRVPDRSGATPSGRAARRPRRRRARRDADDPGQVDETDDESLGDYGDMLDSVGQNEEACERWRRAAEIDPDDGESDPPRLGAAGYPVPEG